MRSFNTFYRRHLPHYQPPGATLFVTFRLHGSIPRQVIAHLQEMAESLERRLARLPPEERIRRLHDAQKQMFARWDACLDQASTGPRWLQKEAIAQVVADALHHLNGKKYDLLAYCIMPNHVHVVFKPLPTSPQSDEYYPLADIMQSIKGFTARQSNRLLKRRGPFWQSESYDHVVRDEEELNRIVEYVLFNPVRAGLVESLEAWKWSYYSG